MSATFWSVIGGCGMSLPNKVIKNNDLAETLDTNDEWIRTRTGIEQRHIASQSDSVALLGTNAANNALLAAKVAAADVDMIILATTSPDHFMPATATKIQHQLGATKACAFDIQAVCSGFIYALSIADQFIKTGAMSNVLVIGAELMSRMVDWNDRSTCVLFGDGAGAVLLRRSLEPGILSTHLFTDGAGYDMLFVDHSDEKFKRGKIVMNGRAIYSTAINVMESSIKTALTHNNLNITDIDWFVAHQANKRIIDSVSTKLGIPSEKTVVTINSYANTSAATIPISLAVTNINKGDLVILSAMGAGYAWGSAAIRW
ncbi:MAG: ketoacyl-ACP synthase III [Holosporales bacterium]|nr:ketoacyl-ACP synthase III [Holosporales bacterium]